MKLKVTVDGKVYEVEVEVAPEPTPVLPTFIVQSAAAAVPAGSGAGGSCISGGAEEDLDEAKVCRSPISGIVVKSMKMETEVTAPVAGKVAQVKVNKGDSVKSGQVVLVWA